VSELQDIHLAEPFTFTKGCRTMKIAARPSINAHQFGTLLFDIQTDAAQEHSMQEAVVERRMIEHMVRLMRENDAPPEQFERLGFAITVPA
jgi:hypothetical protein